MNQRLQPLFLTTPIYYVNGRPHLGNAYTMVVSDAIARWARLRGREVFFLTGTDEHGLKVAQAAHDSGATPQEWVDRMSVNFFNAWRDLGISNDRFLRTTEPAHYRTVQAFLQRIYDNGYIFKDTYVGLYCVACEAYYSEEELTDGGLCTVHLKPVIEMSEENYFFRLSAFEDRLQSWYDENPGAVFPVSRRNEALGFIRGGLDDISISRTSIDWGVPVPWDTDHVFYVWYDALINYLTAISYGEDQANFDHWWPSVCHVLGKDILRFHCVWWPAMCMAAGIEPPSSFVVHGWLLASGEKMSKSRGNNVDPLEVAAEYGLDSLRYYLLRESTLGSDGDFTFEGLVQRHNSDLANNLGNLLQRVVAVVNSKLDGVAPGAPPVPPDILDFDMRVERAVSSWEIPAPQDALEATWELIRSANALLESTEPWKSTDRSLIERVLGTCLEVLRVVCILSSPVLLESSELVWKRLGLEDHPTSVDLDDALHWGGYRGGVPLVKAAPVFPRRSEPS
ncbi:MAG: methionine--tRNA ligase [Acidimicrobiales bacterium]